jgi:hypothetical protein
MEPSPQRRRRARWLPSALWSRSVSVASSAPVQAMDADVMITIAFCLEAALFALAGGIFVLREVRKARAEKARAEAAAAWRGEPDFPRPSAGGDDGKGADTARLVTGPSRRAIRGVRSGAVETRRRERMS